MRARFGTLQGRLGARSLRSAAPPVDRRAVVVRSWLALVWLLVLVMVLIGGITRLTGSGLSIVEWRPVTGVIPPLGDADWANLFAQYRESPQYRTVNRWMTLADFQRIYFWEYVHRLCGRVVGAAVLLPWLYFAWRRRLSRRLAIGTLVLLALGAAQGALGWYMVQSGLVHEPRVSHFRLAAHLLLAFLTGAFTLWLLLEDARPRQRVLRVRPAHVALCCAVIALVSLQTVYGAFMAGTRAGYAFGTFPDMHGQYLPGPFFTGSSPLRDALNDPNAIHYLHRALAWVLLAAAFGVWAWLGHAEPRRAVARAAGLVAVATAAQLGLGALTVVRRVDLPWALAHQAMAYLLLASTVLLLHRALGAAGGDEAGRRASPALREQD